MLSEGQGVMRAADMCTASKRTFHSARSGEKDAKRAGSSLLRTETRRVEAFSDGVLAVAITLLGVDLVSPAHAAGQLLSALLREWPAYLAYTTSFVYIAVIWLNHHQTFVRIRSVDRGTQFANIAVLFTVVLLPFSTEVLADAVRESNRTDADTAVALYALIAGMMCAAWWCLFRHLNRHPDLVYDEHVPYFQQGRLRAAVGITGYAAGGALGYLVDPVAGLAVFLLLPLFYACTTDGLLPLGWRRGGPFGSR